MNYTEAKQFLVNTFPAPQYDIGKLQNGAINMKEIIYVHYGEVEPNKVWAWDLWVSEYDEMEYKVYFKSFNGIKASKPYKIKIAKVDFNDFKNFINEQINLNKV